MLKDIIEGLRRRATNVVCDSCEATQSTKGANCDTI